MTSTAIGLKLLGVVIILISIAFIAGVAVMALYDHFHDRDYGSEPDADYELAEIEAARQDLH